MTAAKSNCAECPLAKHCQQVEAEHSEGDTVVVLDQVDSSGAHNGWFCNGRDADHLLAALRKKGLKRNHLAYVPMIRGQYPGMSRNKYKGAWERANGKKWGVDVPTPEQCCEPWFKEEVSHYNNVIALGPGAARGVLRGNPSFDKTRGTPAFPSQTKYGQNVMLTWAGWMLRSEPKYRAQFQRDIYKGLRFFAGRINPPNPTLIEVNPFNWGRMLGELKRECEKRGITFWDLESAPYDYRYNEKGEKIPVYNTILNPLIVAGMGWEDKVYVANFVGHDWDDAEKEVYMQGYGAILADEKIIKVGQNSIGYDELNMNSLYGFEVNNHRDTMIMKRIVDPEYPKSLAWLAAEYTDAAGWKDGADYSDSSYNAMDCAITHQVYEKLDVLIRKSPQKKAYKKIAAFQKALNVMCRVGVPIDEAKRAAAESKYEAIKVEKLAIIKGIAGPDFNPRSTAQTEKLWYDYWGLTVPHWTKSGAPACDKDAVIELLGSSILNEEQRVFLDAYRRYKLASSLLSSYLKPWAASGVVVRDGRIYPGLNAAGTVGARPSSSRPNMLTCPRALGDLQSPPPGYALIETDLSAAEFMYVIKAAGIKGLQEAVTKGWDTHGTVMHGLLGDAVQRIPGYPEGGHQSGGKGSGQYKMRRTLQKNYNFASLYAAQAAAKRKILRQDKDADWNLLNVGLTHAQVNAWDVRFHKVYPELKAWWKTLKVEHEKYGYIRDDNWGLIRYMPNGFKPTEASNFKAQSTTAGYINDGIVELMKHPLTKSNPETGTGMYLTVYDSVKALVLEDDAEETGALMHATLEVNDPKTGLRIAAETEIRYHGG